MMQNDQAYGDFRHRDTAQLNQAFELWSQVDFKGLRLSPATFQN